jgi:hypothetical protein
MGGGGVETADGIREGEPGPADSSMMRYWDPFEGVTFTFNGTFPSEPTSAPVHQQPVGGTYSLEDVARLAALFGLNGPIYTEYYPTAAEEGWTPVVTYMVFDGSRQLSVSDSYFSYHDHAGAPRGEGDIMKADQGGPIAEAFLKERGLLNFAYERVSFGGYDVEFRRMIDGRPTLFSELQVAVNGNGQVWWVSSTPLTNLAPIGDYPLRPAESAWQMIVNEGIDFNRSFYTIQMPLDWTATTPLPDPDQDRYRYWERSFAEGETITIYPFPVVFQPVNSDVAPRVLVERYTLQADRAELAAIAAHASQQIYVRGVLRNAAGADPILELVEWAAAPNQEYTYRNGTIQRNGEEVFLLTEEGETILIPNAPADLPEAESVYVNGWLVETMADGSLAFNWQGIGRNVEFEQEPEVIITEESDPYQISQVIMTEVDLIYTVNAIYEENNNSSRFIMQPVWRFKGTTNNNEVIEIFVQAVEESYLAKPTAVTP